MFLNNDLNIVDDFPALSYEDWKARMTVEIPLHHLYDGIDLLPLYTGKTWPSTTDQSGFPGNFPFTRGMKPLGHALEGWDIRQEILKAIPAEANADILEELKHGVTSIELKLDKAASYGLDADGSYGLEGVMIYHLGDLKQALDNVPMHLTPVSLDAGLAFLPASALLAALWAKQGVEDNHALGSFNADPIGAFMQYGTSTLPLDVSIEHMADLAAWTDKKYPKVKAIRISTAVYHHAGASSVQDLAYAIATAVDYLRAMAAAGMDINSAVRQISFHNAVGCLFFQSIAKLRALRKLWAKVALSFGAKKEALGSMCLSTTTSRRVMTHRDPWVNLLRNTAACFAGAIGGADSITTLPMDIGLGSSDYFSRHLARNTQLILMQECHLARVIDPAGGSWFLETLTDQLAEHAWSLFQQIEAQGGMAKAVLSGCIHGQIQTVEKQREQDLATRKVGITGISEHADIFEETLFRPMSDHETLCRVASVSLLKWQHTHRDQSALETVNSLVMQSDRPLGLLTEATFKAAKAGATIGQLSASLCCNINSDEIIQLSPLTAHPYASAFEALRNEADHYAKTHGHKRPKVFLINLGFPNEFLAKASYASHFFEVGGFVPITNNGFFEAQTAVKAFVTSGAKIAVICSSEQRYDTQVEQIAPLLKASGADTVVLAGNPGANEMKYRSAGVDQFIFLECNALDVLWGLLAD